MGIYDREVALTERTINSIETASDVKEVRVRRAKRSFGPGTLPYLRAQANEIVAGPEYLLTRKGDEETIWERTFHRSIRVPNRAVCSWSTFVAASEAERDALQGAMAVRLSTWQTHVDLTTQAWKTTSEPSVDSKIGLFSDGLSAIVLALQDMDRLVYGGVRLDRRNAPVEWEEQILERVFDGGVFHLTTMHEVSNERLDALTQSLSEAIESVLSESKHMISFDSLDVIYAGA